MKSPWGGTISAGTCLTMTTDLVDCTIQEPLMLITTTHTHHMHAPAAYAAQPQSQVVHLGQSCLISPYQALIISKVRHSQSSALKNSSLSQLNNGYSIAEVYVYACLTTYPASSSPTTSTLKCSHRVPLISNSWSDSVSFCCQQFARSPTLL